MAASGSGSGTGNRDLFNSPDSASSHPSMRTSTDDVIAKINQQINILKEGAKNEGSRSDRIEQRESTNSQVICHQYPFGPDDFVNDEMSVLGSIDFVALGRLKDSNRCNDSGSTNKGWRSQHSDRWTDQKRFGYRKDSYPMHGRESQNGGYCAYPASGCYPPHHGVHDCPDWHLRGAQGANLERPWSQGSATRKGQGFLIEYEPMGGFQRPLSPPKDLGAQPVAISRRKAKAKLRKRRKKALKAAAKAQAEQGLCTIVTVDDTADSTTERQQVEPEQEGKKRKESPAAADEPEFKIVKAESPGGDATNNEDSTRKMEAADRAATLVTASNTEAEGQSSVLSVEEELAQLKMKLQKKKVPLSDSDAASHTEESNEDLTPASASKSAAEGQSCTFDTKVDFCQQKMLSKKQLEAKTDHATFSTKQRGGQTHPPDGTQRKQGYFGRPGMKITAQRMAFVCPVCKFHSFYRKNMAAHLESKFHKDHFEFLLEHLSEPTVDFLQTHFSNKHKKVEDFISQIPNHRDAICQLYEDRDLTRDISMEHFMRKAEAAHCLACNVYIPMQHSLIQKHLNSPDHNHNCKIMMVQSKNSGLSIAQHILSHRFLHMKLKHYLKDSIVTDVPEMKPEEAWSIGKRAVPDAEADMMKQEVEPFCEQVIQATEAVGDRKDQEAEPLSAGVVPAAETEKNGKEHQAEPMCEGVVPAVEKISNKAVQEETKEHDQTESLFNLLDEEDDVEGVELGEEELGEDDYI